MQAGKACKFVVVQGLTLVISSFGLNKTCIRRPKLPLALNPMTSALVVNLTLR